MAGRSSARGHAVTITGLPFAGVHLKLAGLALWPIGKMIVATEERGAGATAATRYEFKPAGSPRLCEPRWSCRGNPPPGSGRGVQFWEPVKQEAPQSPSRASDRRISRSRVRHGHDLSGCKDAEDAMPNIAIRRAQRPRPERCLTPTCMAIASPPRSHVSNLENPSICADKATDLLLLRLPMVNSTENITARPETSICFSGPSQSS